jgi:phosphoribosylglycinamide formyltransferase-1
MRVGVLCSSGGSAFGEVLRARPDVEFVLVTDRPCGAEAIADQHAVARTRLDWHDHESFSRRAAEAFERLGPPDFVVMFYSRLVTPALLSRLAVLNIHPSLLPAFPGMSAVRQAHRAGARCLGCTLHVAVPLLDAGPIIAQCCQPIGPGDDLATLERRSFVHKVALMLLAIDMVARGDLGLAPLRIMRQRARAPGALINPALSDRDERAVRALQQREGIAFL